MSIFRFFGYTLLFLLILILAPTVGLVLLVLSPIIGVLNLFIPFDRYQPSKRREDIQGDNRGGKYTHND